MSAMSRFERFMLSFKVSKKSANCLLCGGGWRAAKPLKLPSPRCVLNTGMCLFYIIHDIYRAGYLIT